MAVLGARDVERFTPASYEGKEGAPVYLVAPMTVMARAKFQADLAYRGVRYPTARDFVRVVRALLAEFAPDNLADLQAAVDDFEAASGLPEQAPPGDSDDEREAHAAELMRRVGINQEFERIANTLREAPELGDLFRARVMFNQMIPLVAAGYALRGWEQAPDWYPPFRRVAGVVPDEVLEGIKEDDWIAIGNRALELQAISKEQRGN